MIRSLLAVFAGFLWWGLVCVTVTSILIAAVPSAFDETGGTFDVGMNGLLIFLTTLYSVSSGYLTAWIAGRREMAHTLALGAWNLAFGTFVQILNWNLQPVWYHLIFLSLLIPMIALGGWLRLRVAGSLGERKDAAQG